MNGHSADYQGLQNDYLQRGAAFPEPFKLRIHRSLSWFGKAAQMMPSAAGKTGAEADWDMAFVSLWIAFNAAYAKDLNQISVSEKGSLRDFLQTICRLDRDKRIYDLLWRKFSGNIVQLLSSPYVFQDFWDFHNGKTTEQAWKESFDRAQYKVRTALRGQDSEVILSIVFDRLYTLRNQIVHGGATYKSSANRQQLRSACMFLHDCVALILKIMMENADYDAWGHPFYPFIKEER